VFLVGDDRSGDFGADVVACLEPGGEGRGDGRTSRAKLREGNDIIGGTCFEHHKL
jgi:hypothetical protein